MSEEKQEGGVRTNLKAQIATGAGIILAGNGTMFMDEVKSFIGIEDDEPTEQTAPAQNNQQSVNVSGPEIIINIPEQKPAETKTIIVKDTTAKKQPPKKTETEKRKDEGFDW